MSNDIIRFPGQQGDVLCLQVAEMPANAKKVASKNGKYTLREGEVIGHAHVVEADEGVSLMEWGNTFYLSVEAPVIVRHEEHKPITLPAGKYKIGVVREVDPFAEEIRQVRD